MPLSQIFKKVLLPCAVGVGAADAHSFGPSCVKRNASSVKPSELPIYTKDCTVCGTTKQEIVTNSTVEETVGNLRKELWVWQDNVRGYRQRIVDVCRSTLSQGGSSIDYLRAEANGPQRYGAIGVAYLAGHIFGMRGGRFRRILYGACGALAMAALCYPKEAAECTDVALTEGKKNFIVAYHFIYGDPVEEANTHGLFAILDKRLARLNRREDGCECGPFDPCNPQPCILHPDGKQAP